MLVLATKRLTAGIPSSSSDDVIVGAGFPNLEKINSLLIIHDIETKSSSAPAELSGSLHEAKRLSSHTSNPAHETEGRFDNDSS